jgi:Predicted periplasmic or secreted lipoprotein
MVRERPVTYRDFVRVLAHLGFQQRSSAGGSHEQWVHDGPPFRKVTVDKHHAPFHRTLLKLMLAQAQLSKDRFFSILDRL